MKKRNVPILALAAVIFFIPCGAARDGYATQPPQVNTLDVVTDEIASPAGMVLMPDGSLLVVSRRHPGAILKIDLRDDGKASVSGFSTGADLCNARYIAVDTDGTVYVDTSRPLTGSTAGFGSNTVRRAGLFRISRDGKIRTRIENVDDDTLGLAFDREGSLFSCNIASPLAQEEEYSKFAERTSEKIFSSAQALKPYIMKFDLESGSPTSPETKTVKRLDIEPTDIAFDSKGELILVAGQNVMRMKKGFLGMGDPKIVASFSGMTPKVQDSAAIGIDGDDNIYVGLSHPLALMSGIVAEITPDGSTRVIASGLGLVAGIVVDAEDNIYFSDMKMKRVYRIPAASRRSKGILTPPIPAPAVSIAPWEPIKKPEPKSGSKAKRREAEPTPQVSETEELKVELASLETKLRDKEAPLFPDTVVLTTGAKIECEIIDESSDFVRIRTGIGTTGLSRGRIAFLKYAEEDELQESPARANTPTPRREEAEPERAEQATHEEKELLRQAEAGRPVEVEDLLAEGVDPDVRDHNRRTPLMLAANKGHNEVVDILLAKGANIEAQDVDGWTPLVYAAYGGHADTVELLIDGGADVDARINSSQSVLDIARLKYRAAVIQLLQEAGAE